MSDELPKRQLKVYVLGIFPAFLPINAVTGEILDGPHMTDHWINHEKLLWLFDTLAEIQAFFWHLMGVHEYMFPCHISRKDKKWLEDNKIILKPL